MAIGTDDEIFKTTRKKDAPKKATGRPGVDENLALRLFKAKYTNDVIAGHLGKKPDTIRKLRRKFVIAGLLDKDESEKGIVAAYFDDEVKNATGYSFKQWLLNKRKRSGAIGVFNFCEKVWRVTWDRPSLFEAADRTEKLGDQLAQLFLSEFGEDKKRIRQRKKMIRQLFAILGRDDVNRRHLTMSTSRDPRSVRRVPEISMTDFPLGLDAALKEVEERYGLMAVTWLQMKICTGIRTGKRSENRGLLGMSADNKTPCYIFFRGDNWRAQAFEKQGETWPITWIPPTVLKNMRTLYDAASTRENKFIFNWTEKVKRDISKAWKVISLKHTGTELEFHDLRKVSITWLFAMNIPLEIATSINVGWKDLSTAKDHYLELRAFLKKSARLAYQANIPAWYKPGLEEYAREEE